MSSISQTQITAKRNILGGLTLVSNVTNLAKKQRKFGLTKQMVFN